MTGPYSRSVFDDGWATQYELESHRRLEAAQAAARARHGAAESFRQQALDAAAQYGIGPGTTAHELGAGQPAVMPAACSPQCSAGGCQFDRAQNMLGQAQAALESTKRLMRTDQNGARTMSQAVWCDVGQHAYSANDPKAEMWTKKVRDQESGGWREVMLDVCGPCVALGQSPDFNADERAAIMAGAAPHPAPGYLQRRPVPDAPQA